MPQNSTRILILTSGGIDSTACLAYYLCRKNTSVESIFVDYGQSAAVEEFSAVKNVCNHYQTSLKKISIIGIGRFGQGVVTGRNAMLLNTALMYFGNSAGITSIGIHAGTEYADCSKEFVNKMQNIFDFYSDGKVRIDAPFLSWSKTEVWEFCRQQNVPVHLTYSCELGNTSPCGVCLSCKDVEVLRATR